MTRGRFERRSGLISRCRSSIQLEKTERTAGKWDWNGTKHRIRSTRHLEKRNEKWNSVSKILCYGCLNKAHTLTFHEHSKYVRSIHLAGTSWELVQRTAGRPRNRGSIHKEQRSYRLWNPTRLLFNVHRRQSAEWMSWALPPFAHTLSWPAQGQTHF